MDSTVQGKVNINLNVRKETKARIDDLCRVTFRGKGDVIDLAIARLWNDMRTGRVDMLQDGCFNNNTEGD